MLERVLISLLNISVQFLQIVFQKKKIYEDDFFSASSPSETSNNDRLLQEAYNFMELKPTTTIEEAKKQHRRLSLRYHPDRNNQSEESHRLQQKLNASYDRIQQELDEGPVEEKKEEEEIPSPSPPEAEAEGYKDDFLEEHEEQKERQKTKQHNDNMRQVKKEQTKIRREAFLTLTEILQRVAANSLFREKINSTVPDNNTQDDDDQQQKVKNYAIEACTHQLAVSIRLGMMEHALELLNEDFGKLLDQRLQQMIRQAYLLGKESISITEKTMGTAAMQKKIFTQVLDSDNNTILHYAVYWEQIDFIRYLAQTAQTHDFLIDIMCFRNNQGHTPTDFAKISIDPSILPLMKAMEDLVRLRLEQTRIGPAIKKTVRELLELTKCVDPVTALVSLFGLYKIAIKIKKLNY